MADLDKQIRKLVDRIGAEKVTVALTYDRNTFWQRRGRERAQYHYEIVIEWEHGGEERRLDGDSSGRSFAAVFRAVEAQVDGLLLRERLPESADG